MTADSDWWSPVSIPTPTFPRLCNFKLSDFTILDFTISLPPFGFTSARRRG